MSSITERLVRTINEMIDDRNERAERLKRIVHDCSCHVFNMDSASILASDKAISEIVDVLEKVAPKVRVTEPMPPFAEMENQR